MLQFQELREELRERGLNQKGTKRTLLRRLRAAMVNTDADSDSTRLRSTSSLRKANQFDSIAADRTEALAQPEDNISVASSGHFVKSGSSVSESLYIKRAKVAAKRAGLEARMMLLAEKQRLAEEVRVTRQRELELELQQERLDLEMAILDLATREKEFGKFQVNFENIISVNSSNVKPDVKIHPAGTRESRAVSVNISEEEGLACMVSRDRSTNDKVGGRQTVTKIERPAHIQADFCNSSAAPAYELAIAPPDAVTQMLNITERSTLPRVEIEKFDGKVASIRSFIRAFEHLICTKIQNDDEKLYYLEQYTTGQPREIVRGCLHMPIERGYKEARRLFEVRYGNQYRIAAQSVNRILNWPPINLEDMDAMDDFSIALRTCYNSMEDTLTGTSELNHPKTMQKKSGETAA